MPPLYEAGFTGPSDVMWGVDDEIVHELSDISRSWNAETAEGLTSRLEKLVARIREMIYKEEQTLFPLCQENFDKNTWYEVYRDLPDFGWAFIASAPKWLDGEVWSCHPPRVQPIVRSLIADFKAGTRDRMDVWMPKEGVPTHVQYLAVRAEDGTYQGTLEIVQQFDGDLEKLEGLAKGGAKPPVPPVQA
jgi:DUF438 domain-containing protein